MDTRHKIPSIQRLIAELKELQLVNGYPREALARLARLAASRLRESGNHERGPQFWSQLLQPLLKPGPREMINGTGILLHTNLGRSPLDPALVSRAAEAVSGYTDLELDPLTGKRGHRDRHIAELARLIWNVEDATLVNNGASALALALAALASGKTTIASRGELIEIGGGFRIPEICQFAGTRLREVGTTNKTHLADYQQGIDDECGCLLKVHPSNYRVEGFTAEVELAELCRLGQQRALPVVMDLGSGGSERTGLVPTGEPSIESCLLSEPDLLIFSCDKLLAGIQGGLILGKKAALERLRSHPLMRMVRMDKLSISIICHQLADLFRGWPTALVTLAGQTPEQLHERAVRLCTEIGPRQVRVRESLAYMGGGSLPLLARPSSSLIFLDPKPTQCHEAFLRGEPPILGIVQDGHFQINLGSIFVEQEAEIVRRSHSCDLTESK